MFGRFLLLLLLLLLSEAVAAAAATKTTINIMSIWSERKNWISFSLYTARHVIKLFIFFYLKTMNLIISVIFITFYPGIVCQSICSRMSAVVCYAMYLYICMSMCYECLIWPSNRPQRKPIPNILIFKFFVDYPNTNRRCSKSTI